MTVIHNIFTKRNPENPIFMVFGKLSEKQKMSLINLLYLTANSSDKLNFNYETGLTYINKFSLSLNVRLRKCLNYYEHEGQSQLILDLKKLENDQKEYLIAALWKMISLYSYSILKNTIYLQNIFEQIGLSADNYLNNIKKTNALMKYFFEERIENANKQIISRIFHTLPRANKEAILYFLNELMIDSDNLKQIFLINKYCEILDVEFNSIVKWIGKAHSELINHIQILSPYQKDHLAFAAWEMISCNESTKNDKKNWLDTTLHAIGIGSEDFALIIDRFTKIKQEVSIADTFKNLSEKQKASVYEYLLRCFSFLYLSSNDMAYYRRRFLSILSYDSAISLPYMIEISEIDIYRDVKSLDHYQKEILVSTIFGILKDKSRPLKIDKVSLSSHFERIGVDEVMFLDLLGKYENYFKFLEYE